jgi:GNAT superfamily N-acetyltransferase
MGFAISVRPALSSDADGIAQVHLQAWREAYAHLLPAETLAGLDLSERAARWASILAEGGTDVFVALEGTRVVGWASASVGRDPDAPRARELEGIYVLASHHGSGAGQGLLDASIGGEPAFLWMAQDNPRALAFYRRNGFTADGVAASKPLAGMPVAVLRLVR